jgi:phosphatidylglycerophosphate synthase
MASQLVECCEQMDRSVLRMMKQKQSGFLEAKRYQESILSRAERWALSRLAERTPAWINSDHLTILGFVAQLAAGAAYAISRSNRLWLLAVIGALALNWLGDSLDGTLARYRHQQRPRYGFYVDHMVDSFGALALMVGLALSRYMHPYIAIALLIAFLLLSVQSYLATYALGEFRLSYWSFGPTELRLLLSVGNVALFFRPMVHFLGGHYRLFDVGGLIGLIGMTVMLLVWTVRNTCRLYREEEIP